jgi:hypothetical protein
LDEIFNPKTAEFYPKKDTDNRAIPRTGATYFITDIYRIRRADSSEFYIQRGK